MFVFLYVAISPHSEARKLRSTVLAMGFSWTYLHQKLVPFLQIHQEHSISYRYRPAEEVLPIASDTIPLAPMTRQVLDNL